MQHEFYTAFCNLLKLNMGVVLSLLILIVDLRHIWRSAWAKAGMLAEQFIAASLMLKCITAKMESTQQRHSTAGLQSVFFPQRR